MRKPIIAGNWKMYKTIADSVAFAQALIPHMATYPQVDRVVAPSFVALHAVAEALKDTGIQVSSQQVHYEAEGAFTSQISPAMLQGITEYAIIGHSECRQYLNESDETVNKKTKAALKYNLTPIVAIGESIETRRAGEADSFVSNQLRAALVGITAEEVAKIVIAYEPIWAIGTGESATPQIASDMCGGVVRGTLRQLYGDVADVVRIQYGGSVKPDNMLDYMSQPDIDGALVGGASLKVESFTELIKLAVQAKGL